MECGIGGLVEDVMEWSGWLLVVAAVSASSLFCSVAVRPCRALVRVLRLSLSLPDSLPNHNLLSGQIDSKTTDERRQQNDDDHRDTAIFIWDLYFV